MASYHSEIDLNAISRVLRTIVSDQNQNGPYSTQFINRGSPRDAAAVAQRHWRRAAGQTHPTNASALARALRDTRLEAMRAFSDGLICDPAFDMLLEVFIAEEEGERLSISKLLRAAAVPSTTMLRWLKRMESEGILVRKPDQFDARRFFIGLSEETRSKMHKLIGSVPLAVADRT